MSALLLAPHNGVRLSAVKGRFLSNSSANSKWKPTHKYCLFAFPERLKYLLFKSKAEGAVL